MSDIVKLPPAQFLRDDVIRGGMDLLLFAHKSHLRRSDDELAKINLGRAHHRALYFIARQPGLSVGELLNLLGVTKQSLGRVMTDLQHRQLIIQEVGVKDRRQRLLTLSAEGEILEQKLFSELHANMLRAYTVAGENAVNGYWSLMQHLMTPEAREQFKTFHEKSR
jgi:DNA-binding MarR family transcriptional regulator